MIQTALPFSPVEILMGIVTLGSTALNWRFAASISNIKHDIRDAIDGLRREFGGTFLPADRALEQRSSLLERLQALENQHDLIRERYHKQANETTEKLFAQNAKFVEEMAQQSERFTQKIFEQFRTFEESLRENADRLTKVEHTATTAERMLHDHARRISDLERE